MKRQLTILTLTALTVMTFMSAALIAPAPALADGTIQMTGVGVVDGTGECNDAEGQGANLAFILRGDLAGCWYVFVEFAACSPGEISQMIGYEIFVGQYGGETGTFKTIFHTLSKFEDCANLAEKVFGRCQHPIADGSGTGVFAGARGRIVVQDDVEADTYPFKGQLQW